MSKINNKTIYPFDVNITDQDYVIGSDGDNLGKITRNYNIGDLRRYINSGLSPEVGGTLKVSEITYNGVLTSPSEVANALDPNYQVLQYHIVIFSVNGNKYILKEQDITLGLSGTAVTDEDFILIIGFTKLGDGTNVLKGYNTSTGLHEFYSIKKDGNLLNLTESLGNIVLSIDETELSEFIKENGKTYSVLNVGTGVGIYKDTTVAGDNTQFNFKSIKSNTNNITLVDDDIFIDAPETASIPALYVNNLYIPTEAEFLAGNTKGEGTLAKPFTDTVTAYVAGVPTITANTAIQNALDAYVGSGTRLSPERVGEKIIVQDNNSQYTFPGNFGYSRLKIDVNAFITHTGSGMLSDMDNALHFNTNQDSITITIGEGYFITSESDGMNNSGTNVATNNFSQTRTINLFGTGTIYFPKPYLVNPNNNITKYIVNSDVSNTGNNNDGGVTFDIRCKIRADYQGLVKVGGVSRVHNYGEMQSGVYNVIIDPSLKAFLLLGGQFRNFKTSSLQFSGGNRTDGFVFTPTGGFTPRLIGQSSTIISLSKITNLFNKTNNNAANLVFVNSDSSVLLDITNIFESTNLWSVTFNQNYFESGLIDNTKVDLTNSNSISSTNIIGANIIQNLRVYASKADAKTASLPVNSIFLKRVTVDADDLVAGVEYKIATSGSPSLGTVGDFLTATGTETGTGTAYLETIEIL